MFDFRRATDFLWDDASQSTKSLDMLKIRGGIDPLASPTAGRLVVWFKELGGGKIFVWITVLINIFVGATKFGENCPRMPPWLRACLQDALDSLNNNLLSEWPEYGH